MHILPPLETVKDIAATQQYDVLPLSCEILSDFITPIEAMRILKNVSTHCYMLESAQADDRWGRYTFLGFDPKLEITCIDGKMKAGGLTVRTDDPSQYLRELLSSYRSPRFDYLPSPAGSWGIFLTIISNTASQASAAASRTRTASRMSI